MGGLLGAQLCHCPAPAHPTRNSGTNAAGYFELTVLRLTGESRQLRPQFRACRHGSGVASRPSAHAPPLLARTPPPHPCASWPTANIAHTTCLTTALDSTAGADVPGLHQRGRKGRAEPAPVAHPCNAVHPPPPRPHTRSRRVWCTNRRAEHEHLHPHKNLLQWRGVLRHDRADCAVRGCMEPRSGRGRGRHHEGGGSPSPRAPALRLRVCHAPDRQDCPYGVLCRCWCVRAAPAARPGRPKPPAPATPNAIPCRHVWRGCMPTWRAPPPSHRAPTSTPRAARRCTLCLLLGAQEPVKRPPPGGHPLVHACRQVAGVGATHTAATSCSHQPPAHRIRPRPTPLHQAHEMPKQAPSTVDSGAAKAFGARQGGSHVGGGLGGREARSKGGAGPHRGPAAPRYARPTEQEETADGQQSPIGTTGQQRNTGTREVGGQRPTL